MWFRNPLSGQVFEAVGVWERYARAQGCIPAPVLAPTALPPAEPGSSPETGSSLPPDFPHLDLLAAAGITTREQLAGMNQTQLAALPGIGRKAAKAILAAL